MSHSAYVLNVLLDDLRAAVALGVRRTLAYEAGETDGLADAMVAIVDGIRIARKFGDTSRHKAKSAVSEEYILHTVDDFETNEYGRRQAETALGRDRLGTLTDIWAWLNELGSYIPASPSGAQA